MVIFPIFIISFSVVEKKKREITSYLRVLFVIFSRSQEQLEAIIKLSLSSHQRHCFGEIKKKKGEIASYYRVIFVILIVFKEQFEVIIK